MRAQKLTRKEQEELGQIKANLTLDPENKMLSFRYPLISEPHLLTDNKGQAVAMAAGLERKLLKTPGDLDAHNSALKDFLKKG